MWTTTSLILASAVLAGAQSNGLAAYLSSVCAPRNSSGYPDFNAPCNAVYAIQAQCIYGGPDFLNDLWNLNISSPNDGNSRRNADPQSQDGDESSLDENNLPSGQSDENQRVCVCESQFWDQLAGCVACYTAHAPDSAVEADIQPSQLSSASSSYCAASATASVGLAGYLYNVFGGLLDTGSGSSATETSTVNFRDPIGNKTEVSYYYTAAVTGSAAWLVSQPTGESSASQTYTTTNVQDGQIRPTASANNADATQTSSGNSTGGDSDSSASRFNMASAGCLVGLVALVAWL